METINAENVTGVECGSCHDEAFQLIPREVTYEVRVCPRCARRIDAGQEEQIMQNAVKAMEKSERKRWLREQSLKWADKLDSKKVVVYWDDDTHSTYCTPESGHHVKGTAYRATNASGGWGEVKVVLDPKEHHRVAFGCHYTLYCDLVKRDMFHASVQCGNDRCRHLRPIIDGQRFGLFLNVEDGVYTCYFSWASRRCLVQDEELPL